MAGRKKTAAFVSGTAKAAEASKKINAAAKRTRRSAARVKSEGLVKSVVLESAPIKVTDVKIKTILIDDAYAAAVGTNVKSLISPKNSSRHSSVSGPVAAARRCGKNLINYL